MSDLKYSHILDEQAYFGNDLGAVYSKDFTVFKVWAPSASDVVLKLYKTGDMDESISVEDMTKGENGVWSIKIDGDIKNTYYQLGITQNVTPILVEHQDNINDMLNKGIDTLVEREILAKGDKVVIVGKSEILENERQMSPYGSIMIV